METLTVYETSANAAKQVFTKQAAITICSSPNWMSALVAIGRSANGFYHAPCLKENTRASLASRLLHPPRRRVRLAWRATSRNGCLAGPAAARYGDPLRGPAGRRLRGSRQHHKLRLRCVRQDHLDLHQLRPCLPIGANVAG